MDDVLRRQLSGWALLVNGVIGALLALVTIIGAPRSDGVVIAQLIGSLLLIVGLPAIQLAQPKTGRLGWLGIGLMELAAVIAVVVMLLSLLTSVDIPASAPLTSALAGAAGSVLVGALTVRARVFPAWTGWALAIAGVANLVTGLVPGSPALTIIASLFGLLGACALVGYGWSLLQGARGVKA